MDIQNFLGGEKNAWKSVLTTLLSIVLLTWAWKMYNWLWLAPRRKERILKQQGFKGNSYTFMRLLFGDVKENSMVYAEALEKTLDIHDEAIPRVMPFVHRTLQKYGKKSFMWVGPRPRVFIMDPELMKTVMTKHNNFKKNFKVTNSIVQTIVTGILGFEGKKWSKDRTIMNPIFHMEKLKQLVPKFQITCEEILGEWKDMVGKEGSAVVDVFPYLEKLTSRVVSRTLFASDPDKDKHLVDLLKEMAYMARQTTRIVDLPGAKYLPTETNRRCNQIMSEVRKLLNPLIKERAKAIQAGENVEDNFFNVLLGSHLAEAHGINSKNLDDIFGHTKLFYFAGWESTANMLVWCMILLSIHQDWQEKARQEAFQVFDDRKTDSEGISQLKIIPMILNETLRLYPPVVELSRLVEEETQLGEYTIPADTLLMLPLTILHRDPEYWGEDANEFNPGRFSEGVLKATKGRPAFFPFGWGGRICIGQNYSLMESKVILANFLREFTFELSPTYTHAPYVVFTVQPQYGAPLILRKLNK